MNEAKTYKIRQSYPKIYSRRSQSYLSAIITLLTNKNPLYIRLHINKNQNLDKKIAKKARYINWISLKSNGLSHFSNIIGKKKTLQTEPVF